MKTTTASVVILIAVCGNIAADDPVVQLRPGSDTLEITIGRRPFAVFNHSRKLPKPFLSPVHAPDGTVLTRTLDPDASEDHPHQKGIWISVDEVNEVDFWSEKGPIVTQSVRPLVAAGNPASFEVVNHWQDNKGETVVTEQTVMTVHANGLLACDITFLAGDHVVRFDDTKEGLFGFRMADPLRESETGTVCSSAGVRGSTECWGRPGNWIDYYGVIDGRTYGVTIFDHPLNFRPSRFHVRNYGLFSISPFGERAYTQGKRPAEPLILPPGGSVRLRYAMYVHAGDTATAQVPEMYLNYLRRSR